MRNSMIDRDRLKWDQALAVVGWCQGISQDSESRKATVMKRCDWCGGRFGLISHQHYRKRFCRKTCKAEYVQSRRRILSLRISQWLHFLCLPYAEGTMAAESLDQLHRFHNHQLAASRRRQ